MLFWNFGIQIFLVHWKEIKLIYCIFLLQGDKTPFLTKQFTEFILVVESSVNGASGTPIRSQVSRQLSQSTNNVPMLNGTTFTSRSSLVTNPANSAQRSGKFQLLGDVLTRFSDHCTNTVTQTSSVAKSEIQVTMIMFCK